MSGGVGARWPEPEGRLSALRADDRRRAAVVLAGILLGLGLGSVHWLGLVLGGAVVALPTRSPARGVAAGAGLGVLSLVVFAGLVASQGALGRAAASGQVLLVSSAVGLAGPVLGSLVRGVV